MSRGKNIPGFILLTLVITLVAFSLIISAISKPRPVTTSETRATEISPPPVIFPTTGIIPQIIKNKKIDAELLPGMPAHFPHPVDSRIVSSYTGYVQNNPGLTAYGASWLFSNNTAGNVMEEEYMNEEKYVNDVLTEYWIFDDPPDISNPNLQTLRAHNKSGQYFWLSITQQGQDVLAKVDFVML